MSPRMSAYARPRILSATNYHIANRFSFGVNEALIAQMRRAGSASKWMNKQLVPSSVKDARGSAVVKWYPRLRDTPGAAWKRVESGDRSAWEYGYDFVSYSLSRRVVSSRQVHEVMTDFWSNLLYIPAYEDRSFPWRYSYDNAIRRNALGSFRGLLRATVVHPAMSGWLNNNSNTKRGINENLGRELLELFTVGRPAGYDEDDVQNSARLLTGYKVRVFDGFAASYEPNDHYTGAVRILDFKHRNSAKDGRAAVGAYLDYLARHPATARRIATRMCVRFVSDTPSSAIVSSVARSYLRHDTSIKAAMRTMMAHPDFAKSRLRKVRTPIEDVISAARVLGYLPTGARDGSFARSSVWMCENVGQSPFNWPRPDGFPEQSTTWASPARVLRSWNMHYAFAGNWWGAKDLYVPKKASTMPVSWPRALGQLVDHQSRMLLGRPSTSEMRVAAAKTVNLPQSHSFKSAADVSDWTWVLIRGAVLNSPEGMLR